MTPAPPHCAAAEPSDSGAPAWRRAVLAAALFATDPAGTGLLVRARPGPVRDRFLSLLRHLLPPACPWRIVPTGIDDGRLLGELDLAATLKAGRPRAARGLLADAHGGVVVVSGAQLLPGALAARIAAVMEAGAVTVERDGLSLRQTTRFGLVAIDEGVDPEECAPTALAEQVAMAVDLAPVSIRDMAAAGAAPEAVALARTLLAGMSGGDAVVESLCAVSTALGVASARAWLAAVKVARCHAALAGRTTPEPADGAAAAALVLAHRATCLPAAPADEPDPPSPPDRSEDGESGESRAMPDHAVQEMVLEAVAAALPPGLLAVLQARSGSTRGAQAGRAGAATENRWRGRPLGARPGHPRQGRVALVETLRAAAPWQVLRRKQAEASGGSRILVTPGDLRIRRYEHHSETTTIFAVDASGSSALQRLAEAKGAVELMLGECYVRRDRVALIAFRGHAADLVLPPTRSLTRARRCLAGMPGGGGTPLACGLDAAALLAEGLVRRGHSAALVVLTDGRANIARDGSPGRARAAEDALEAGRRIRAAGVPAILVDTSPQPQVAAGRLAGEMGAHYLPLPYADASRLSAAVRAALPRH